MIPSVMFQKITDLPLHPNRARGIRAAHYNQIFRIVQRFADILVQIVRDRELLQIPKHQSEFLLSALAEISGNHIAFNSFVELTGVLRIQRLVTIAYKGFVLALR